MGNKGNVSTENQNGVVEEVVVVDQILAPTEQNSSELAELTANSLRATNTAESSAVTPVNVTTYASVNDNEVALTLKAASWNMLRIKLQ